MRVRTWAKAFQTGMKILQGAEKIGAVAEKLGDTVERVAKAIDPEAFERVAPPRQRPRARVASPRPPMPPPPASPSSVYEPDDIFPGADAIVDADGRPLYVRPPERR